MLEEERAAAGASARGGCTESLATRHAPSSAHTTRVRNDRGVKPWCVRVAPRGANPGAGWQPGVSWMPSTGSAARSSERAIHRPLQAAQCNEEHAAKLADTVRLAIRSWSNT